MERRECPVGKSEFVDKYQQDVIDETFELNNTYGSQTVITADTASFFILLQAHRANVFPYTHDNSSTVVFRRIEERGDFLTETIAFWTLVANEIDSNVYVLVALAFKFEEIKVSCWR